MTVKITFKEIVKRANEQVKNELHNPEIELKKNKSRNEQVNNELIKNKVDDPGPSH
ncbi:MAG: hypothetical protein ACI32O_01825 [Enterococcus sp.]|uniref:hypothetical protein n=1 Tax=Candidatus Enterococcus wittei TaxID=1987383 RepID=UPI0012B60BA9|nr:hypothetical protein [Enterococcus sp. 10A9_DIV0425]